MSTHRDPCRESGDTESKEQIFYRYTKYTDTRSNVFHYVTFRGSCIHSNYLPSTTRVNPERTKLTAFSLSVIEFISSVKQQNLLVLPVPTPTGIPSAPVPESVVVLREKSRRVEIDNRRKTGRCLQRIPHSCTEGFGESSGKVLDSPLLRKGGRFFVGPFS